MKHKVLIYSKINCSFCAQAKAFFNSKKIEFEEIDLTYNLDELAILMKKTNHKTVPQIFIDDIFIGGYVDLISKYESGKILL